MITDAQLAQRLQDGCPHCGSPLRSFARSHTDEETGKKRSSGHFMGCSSFGKTCQAKYNVSLNTNRESNW